METAEKVPQVHKTSSIIGRIAGIFRKPHQLEPVNLETTLEDQGAPPLNKEGELASTMPGTGEGREKRIARIAEYQISKQAVAADETPLPASTEAASISPHTAIAKDRKLPSGFKEVKKDGQVLRLTQEDMPWLKTDENCNLVLITMRDSKNSQLYFGSLIRGKNLIDAANNMNGHQKNITDNLLYTHLPAIGENGIIGFAGSLVDTTTRSPIFYFANKGGQRVYFMQFKNINNIPVIVRVAVCDKANQADVLTILTTKTHRDVKQFGKI